MPLDYLFAEGGPSLEFDYSNMSPQKFATYIINHPLDGHALAFLKSTHISTSYVHAVREELAKRPEGKNLLKRLD